ncbi:MAG: condensation domain-containing protein [Pseudobdellovibrionaceae bacterium]|nr:condensation domain-containing protein [Pseudobdellovibrionaceae bacterium]
MARGRLLGGMERLFHQQNQANSSNMCAILLYEGSIDKSMIPQALAEVRKVFPLLTARIVADPYLRYEEADGEIPYQILERKDDEHYRLIVRDEVRRKYDDVRMVLTVVEGQDRGELIFSIDHVLADAKSLYVVCQYFIAAMKGRQHACVPVGDCWEKRVTKPYRGFRGFWKRVQLVRRLFKGLPQQPRIFGRDIPHVHTHSFGFQLDSALVKELKVKTDAHQTNLNAIFCAAAMLAAFDQFAGGEAGVFGLNTPVSLREQLDPPASGEEMGMFLSGCLQWHELAPQTDIWQLARNILANLREAVKSGDPIVLGQLGQGPKKPLPIKESKARERLNHAITVSNPGRLEAFEDLPNARIYGYRNLGSLWQHESITVVVLTYGDYLCVDAEISVERLGHFPDAARKLAEGIRGRIMELIEG